MNDSQKIPQFTNVFNALPYRSVKRRTTVQTRLSIVDPAGTATVAFTSSTEVPRGETWILRGFFSNQAPSATPSYAGNIVTGLFRDNANSRNMANYLQPAVEGVNTRLANDKIIHSFGEFVDVYAVFTGGELFGIWQQYVFEIPASAVAFNMTNTITIDVVPDNGDSYNNAGVRDVGVR